MFRLLSSLSRQCSRPAQRRLQQRRVQQQQQRPALPAHPQQRRALRTRPGVMQVLQACENLPAAATEPPAKQPRLGAPAGAGRFRVKLLNEAATPPKRGSAGAAGYDLSSAEELVIPARGKAAVHTGLAIHVPHGTYGRVAPRSGLAAKHFIDVGAGVIDEDYRGEVLVLLFNHGEADFKVRKGDRIAQLVLEAIVTPEVEVVEELDDTSRGAGGFGSTGVSAGGGQ